MPERSWAGVRTLGSSGINWHTDPKTAECLSVGDTESGVGVPRYVGCVRSQERGPLGALDPRG